MSTTNDRLDGAEAIATYLGKKPRWVYQAREQKWPVPIRKREGMGIYAFKSELDSWLQGDDALPHCPST
ncbi:hypothetical protein [Brevundimonas sp.]|uniref:hypothetical protein n=1 Tax=Brevundimonas sp. TaxID=1871086 RepID=UPI0028993687|nr:hypothetical protein [Brevundimonas sp.]